ncbi:MAG: hypothetical protein A2925_03015 [Candidatus Yanofskybacteria bacterium RIFCSPLOWO2_01_FULL_44_22]|uniref:Uncharacterized protein n=2 Tax=Candidatus Yanofskyibacteriota TaxID=1752733 RepID=A0A1F8GIP7_9BACT|nr:MAG: hypothetical protein UW79_C0033G0005 [Candidatus Yanofskybacteria bacterium GW2011_GWA2_44_9]OGN04863.1 MAG: hypothetical protein A2659_04645 [Candidatus Yanofskybacteria bacterium RIFCSPHIGHO2_01_FULL_44_24]OGN25181.1 MAG: hypothetical protein A2925_03015 [Candidatus Yanofskybacteria bacterium RIFCSPLOWO2_01_FULL_44_22]
MYKYIRDRFGVVPLMAIGLVIAVGGVLILQNSVSVRVNLGSAEYEYYEGDGAPCAKFSDNPYYCGGQNIGDKCTYESGWLWWKKTNSGTCQQEDGKQNTDRQPICYCKTGTEEDSDSGYDLYE